ncbi:MAG TPA: hypothetical protein VGG28_15655 [Kofleriaceae bacterium]|jgi:hypothetical protein|nr:hypothetical protein [Kofleriaceae bacterium]
MSRLFISVDRLDSWTAEGRASLEGDRMTLTELNRAFSMTPAVCFVSTTGQSPDPHDLVGRVKSKPQLEQMGAEQLSNSVIYNDTAYDVIDGFIGEPLLP